MILAGDTGGTKTVLALFERRAGALAVVREQMFRCADYPSLEAIVSEFLGPAPARPTSACFGVAGPVVGQTAKITNLPWTIDARILSTQLGGIPVSLLNDLQATALGALALPDSAFAVLQTPAGPTPHATIAVIAPGTGLGEAMLVSDGTRYRALPSEGGHADFAPGTETEIELLRYLRGRYGSHVSCERVLSGNGIGDLYDFARISSGIAEPAWLTDQLATGDRNAIVSRAGVDETDPVCVRALELFADILGAEAGNLALRAFATGGVVIGGGIPPKILPVLQRSGVIESPGPGGARSDAQRRGGLIARFADKGRFGVWARSLGVRVTLEPRAALFGAAQFTETSS